MSRGSSLFTELTATRNLTKIVDRGAQPNQQSHSDNYLEKCLPKHEVGQSVGFCGHGLLSHQILFLNSLRGLLALSSGNCVISRAAVRRSALFDRFPLDFARRALPTDAWDGWNGFWGALLGMEARRQQDGCNQDPSNKNVGPAKKQSSLRSQVKALTNPRSTDRCKRGVACCALKWGALPLERRSGAVQSIGTGKIPKR